MESYYYIALYVVICIAGGLWAEYRYKKGVKDGNNLSMISKEFKKEFDKILWEEQISGSKQMLDLLQKKQIIRVDTSDGTVYGIANSSYNALNDLTERLEKEENKNLNKSYK